MALSFPTIVLRLSLALVLGAIIGLERESREHEAGMRTNALIAGVDASLQDVKREYVFMKDPLGT